MEHHLSPESLPYYSPDLIAKAGTATLCQAAGPERTFDRLFTTRRVLEEQHPENIVLRNGLSYLLYRLPGHGQAEAAIKARHQEFLASLQKASAEAAGVGAKRISAGGRVFVHSLNDQLYRLLLKAAQYKKFSVSAVEHAPHSLGSQLARKLAEKGVEVKVFPDLAIAHAAEGADACFLGAEAFLPRSGVSAKLGSRLAAEAAGRHRIPVYACGHSWKVDHEEATAAAAAGGHGRGYELLPHRLVTATITDLGIHRPEHLAAEARIHHRWLH